MWIEAKKLVKRPSAFTLVELILVVGTIALVAGALVGLVGNSYKDWKLGSDRSTLLQDGQAAVEQMVRILRQAQAFSAVSQSTDQAGYITFTNVDGTTTEQFRLNANALTNELEYGQPGSLSVLTGSVSSLVFTCYDINSDVLTGAVPTSSIQSVQIEMTLTDGTNSFTLSSRAFLHKDFQYVVINEFMYHPDVKAKDEKKYEWVELYNLSDSAVDLTGWTIWTDRVQHDDTLIADPQFGNGSTTIPANGYAVITADKTKVYTELVENGGFEKELKKKDKNWERSNWDKIKDEANAHGGKHYLVSVVSGAAWVYQDISIPPSLNSCLFIFWEMTTASVDQTQMTVTIRSDPNQIGYSGQMHSDWTCHTMDVTAYAGQSIRIYFSTTNDGSGALLLDDVSMASSYVDIDAIRLGVADDKIGNELASDGDTVAITDGSATIDSVSYSSSWDQSNDGCLERIDPQGGSNDSANWQSAGTGTPGSAN